ncbi:MAG TPA: CHRD domain-containing protein [Polyangiaceae bacterium]|nr:CHRD domain-containing protein [Polyangiaceae bacterium]
MRALRGLFLCVALLSGCGPEAERSGTAPATKPSTPAVALASASPAPAPSAAATAPASSGAAPAGSAPAAPALDPGRGGEIGLAFEAFLTPHQEPDEEENTPSTTPQMFRSTTPSLSRAQREAAGHRGHGQVRFSKDLSRAFVDVRVEGVKAEDVNMFHIHCGKPGILGPILVDFALATDLKANLADGLFSVEIRNEHLVKTAEHGHGVIGAFTMGCVIPSPSLGTLKPTKVSTVAGMAQIAAEGELYFNLHTTGQTYFGDMRGQIHPASK